MLEKMPLYMSKCRDSYVIIMKDENEVGIVRSKWKSKIPRRHRGKRIERDYAGGEIMIDNNCLKSERQ